jgi:hypothetical protein
MALRDSVFLFSKIMRIEKISHLTTRSEAVNQRSFADHVYNFDS